MVNSLWGKRWLFIFKPYPPQDIQDEWQGSFSTQAGKSFPLSIHRSHVRQACTTCGYKSLGLGVLQSKMTTLISAWSCSRYFSPWSRRFTSAFAFRLDVLLVNGRVPTELIRMTKYNTYTVITNIHEKPGTSSMFLKYAFDCIILYLSPQPFKVFGTVLGNQTSKFQVFNRPSAMELDHNKIWKWLNMHHFPVLKHHVSSSFRHFFHRTFWWKSHFRFSCWQRCVQSARAQFLRAKTALSTVVFFERKSKLKHGIIKKRSQFGYNMFAIFMDLTFFSIGHSISYIDIMIVLDVFGTSDAKSDDVLFLSSAS